MSRAELAAIEARARQLEEEKLRLEQEKRALERSVKDMQSTTANLQSSLHNAEEMKRQLQDQLNSLNRCVPHPPQERSQAQLEIDSLILLSHSLSKLKRIPFPHCLAARRLT